MKAIFALTLLLASSFAWAAANPAMYTVSVHVVSSHLVTGALPSQALNQSVHQTLDVVIDGKRYQLSGEAIYVSDHMSGLIALGDYKARIIYDKKKGTYLFLRVYEFLFPDGTTGKFGVSGESE